jgi:hypothetical protein
MIRALLGQVSAGTSLGLRDLGLDLHNAEPVLKEIEKKKGLIQPDTQTGALRIIALAVLSFLIAHFVVLAGEAIRRGKQDPVEAQRLATRKQYLRSWF